MLTLKEAYDLGVKMGVKADPRGAKRVQNYLDRVKKEFTNLRPADKEYFDQERLVNPYHDDCRIHTGDLKASVKRILAGIDVGVGEILLATQLNERGQKIDAVLGHHPMGGSLATLSGVMDMITEMYEDIGMPIHTAEKLMGDRIGEVGRGLHPYNHYQIIDTARILGVNLVNMHTPTDNLVNQFLQNFLDQAKAQTIGDAMEVLMEIPEFKEAKKRGIGPVVWAGSPKNKMGKYFVEMTGGTNPPGKAYPELSRIGISTVVTMHMRDDAREKASEQHMNIIITGHMASDSLGMNLYLDELEKKGVEIIPCGGLIRVSRVGKKK